MTEQMAPYYGGHQAELKGEAFEALMLNQCDDFQEWRDVLVEQYGESVIDAFGTNPFEVEAALSDLWESPYYDRASDHEFTYAQWANVFRTDEARDIYYSLVETLKTLDETD